MRWAASTVGFRGPGWVPRLGELRQAGFDTVELWAGYGPDSRDSVTFNFTDPQAIEAVSSALTQNDIVVHSMHGPMFLGPPAPDSPFGQSGLEGLILAEKAAIDAVMALGGRFLLTQDAAEYDPPEAPHLASRDALLELADYAAEHGCVFCIENGGENQEGLERLIGFVHELAHPGLGICIDTGHAQVWGYCDVPRTIREAGQWLRSVHLHDNVGSADAHLAVGDGILPWHAILEALTEVAYRGPLLCELRTGGGRGQVVDVLTRSRVLLDSLAGPIWKPIASVEDRCIFVGGEADRARVKTLLKPDGLSRALAGAGMMAVDRFGDPVAWCEFETGDASRLALVTGGGSDNDTLSKIEDSLVDLLLRTESAPDAFAASGRAAATLERLGHKAGDEGRYNARGKSGSSE